MRVLAFLLMSTVLEVYAELPQGVYSRCIGKTVDGISGSVESVVTITENGSFFDTTTLIVGNKECEVTQASAMEIQLSKRSLKSIGDQYEMKLLDDTVMVLSQFRVNSFNQKKFCGISDWKIDEFRDCKTDSIVEFVKISKTEAGIILEFANGEKRGFERDKSKMPDLDFIRSSIERAKP